MPDDNGQEKAKVEAVDINDLSLVGEEVEVSEKDAFSAPAPPPDGEHLAVIQPTLANKFTKHIDKSGKPYYAVPLEVRLTEPGGKYDNWPLFDNFVSTMIRQSTGTCRMAGVLRAAGVAVSGRIKDIDLARKLHETTQGKPSVKVTSQWHGYCKTCEKDVLTGMNKFPPDVESGRKSTVACPNCGSEVTAQAQITRYSLAQ